MTRISDRFDRYTLALLATVVLAILLPARGQVAQALDGFSILAIAALFFLYGARLARDAIVAGLLHWRLHALILALTFGLFPLLGLAMQAMPGIERLPPALLTGVLYLCVLPSTVQSSIAFTSMAGGNVAAAVCSASLSNLAGVFVTPLLVTLMLDNAASDASIGLDALGKIVLQIFVPFVLGHLARPWLAPWLDRRKTLLGFSDRGTVLLIVYLAFSASMVEGLWSRVAPWALGLIVLLVLVLLALALLLSTQLARRLGFALDEEIPIVFCGSKKSLASGVPMAKILFAGNPALGMIVLPALLYHQIQLIACAVLAQRYARLRRAA